MWTSSIKYICIVIIKLKSCICNHFLINLQVKLGFVVYNLKITLSFVSGISTSFEGKHGSIRYWVKAEIDKPWSFNHKTKKAFTVISPIDINRPEYMVSIDIKYDLGTW